MKKVISVLLILCMLFALVACGADKAEEAPAEPAPASEPAAEAPAEEKEPAAEAPAEEAPAEEAVNPHVGYFDDDVDHFARDPYNVTYIVKSILAVNEAHFRAMETMQDVLNIKVNMLTADDDKDKYINNIETSIVQGIDGLIVEPDTDMFERIYEVLEEYDATYTFHMNGYYDEEGHNLVPVVVLDQYLNGQTQCNWMIDHYKDYWGDMDTSKIALMTLDFSANPDLITRINGVKDTFTEFLPNNQQFSSDLVSAGFGVNQAYDEAAKIFAAHPEVEYWWVFGVVEDFGQGAARAVEDYEKDDCALIVTSGANLLPIEWDSGYNGSWVSSYAVFNYNYVVPNLCGLIALMDGRATHETLWLEDRLPGDICTRYLAGNTMVTIDNYKQAEADTKAMFGIYE